jgi:HAD superfamily hydrolase (TIGR01484 family)
LTILPIIPKVFLQNKIDPAPLLLPNKSGAGLTIAILKDTISNRTLSTFFERSIMNEKSAIFVDIDECLLSSSGNVCRDYYEANVEIAKMVMAGQVGRGPLIRLCSGRDRSSVEMVAKFFGMVNYWAIVESGAFLFNPTTHKFLPNPVITPETEKLFGRLEKGVIPAILKRHDCLQKCLGYKICQVLEKRSGSSVSIEAIYNEIMQGRWIKHNWSLRKLALVRKIDVKHYFDRILVVLPNGVNKGSGAKFLAEIEGLDLSSSIAIGDSELDISLFRRVKHIGCPSNATSVCKEFVKNRRGRISKFPYTQGVLDVINWYLGSQE